MSKVDCAIAGVPEDEEDETQISHVTFSVGHREKGAGKPAIIVEASACPPSLSALLDLTLDTICLLIMGYFTSGGLSPILELKLVTQAPLLVEQL